MLSDKNECLIIQTEIQYIFTAFEDMTIQYKIKEYNPLCHWKILPKMWKQLIQKDMPTIISGVLKMLATLFSNSSADLGQGNP